MIISIEELENTPEGAVNLDFNEQIKDLDTQGPVKGELVVRLTPYGLNVEGNVKTDIILECDRCTKNFLYHLNIDIDEKFIKNSLDLSEGKEIELKDENFVEELKGKDRVDITDLIYQEIILNIPTKHLCQEACKGNDEFQKLQSEKPLDPRLEVFKNFSVEDDKR